MFEVNIVARSDELNGYTLRFQGLIKLTCNGRLKGNDIKKY